MPAPRSRKMLWVDRHSDGRLILRARDHPYLADKLPMLTGAKYRDDVWYIQACNAHEVLTLAAFVEVSILGPAAAPCGVSPTVIIEPELVPKTCWGRTSDVRLGEANDAYVTALRSELDDRCQTCGTLASKTSDIWSYDDRRRTRHFLGIEVTCELCWLGHHMGAAQNLGRYEEALAHVLRINSWSRLEWAEAMDAATNVWRVRSSHDWIDDWQRLAA